METFGAARKDPVGGVVVGLTSPLAGDGKTLTSINLAGSLAQDSNARVLLTRLEGLETERTLVEPLFDSEDAKEGLSAFMEKRKPEFSK